MMVFLSGLFKKRQKARSFGIIELTNRNHFHRFKIKVELKKLRGEILWI